MNDMQQPGDTRTRVYFWQSLRALSQVMRDPENTEAGARFVLGIEGKNADVLFDRFRGDPKGARIIREKRSLNSILSDREYLRALPEGSLGRAYLEFVEVEQISAEGLAAATDQPSHDLLQQSPERRILHERITDTHDLWHIVTGYSRDLIGELLLIAFGYEQLKIRAYKFFITLSYLTEFRAPGTRALVRDARERGRNAKWLIVEDWERLLDRPLADVRKELGLGEPPRYTRHFRVGGKLVPEESDWESEYGAGGASRRDASPDRSEFDAPIRRG